MTITFSLQSEHAQPMSPLKGLSSFFSKCLGQANKIKIIIINVHISKQTSKVLIPRHKRFTADHTML